MATNNNGTPHGVLASEIEAYWAKHPFQQIVARQVQTGRWITNFFEWLFMYISLFSAYIMTFAVGYLIFYAIESKHALDAVVSHPTWVDNVAVVTNQIINIAPELVFPGVAVLCIRAFTVRKWINGTLWLFTSLGFATLTLILLRAFMSGGINSDFLSAMLFWRAFAAIVYTVVVAYCGGNDGLDFQSLLRELEALHVQFSQKNDEVSSVQQRLQGVQSQVSTVQQQLDTERKTVSSLRTQLDTEQQKVSRLQASLDSGQGETGQLMKGLSAAKIQVDTLKMQIEAKTQEVDELKKALSSGQDWKVDNITEQLQEQLKRVSSLSEDLKKERQMVSNLEEQLNTERGETGHLSRELDSVKKQLHAKNQEASIVHLQLQEEQKRVSSVQSLLSSEQQKVSSLRVQMENLKAAQVSSGQQNGREKVVQLDPNRTRKSIVPDQLESLVRALLQENPGMSGREIARELGCSPTTASNWKKQIEEDQQQVVNE